MWRFLEGGVAISFWQLNPRGAGVLFLATKTRSCALLASLDSLAHDWYLTDMSHLPLKSAVFFLKFTEFCTKMMWLIMIIAFSRHLTGLPRNVPFKDDCVTLCPGVSGHPGSGIFTFTFHPYFDLELLIDFVHLLALLHSICPFWTRYFLFELWVGGRGRPDVLIASAQTILLS